MSDMQQQSDWLCVGVFVGAHGVRGDVRLKLFVDDVAALDHFDAFYTDAGQTPLQFKVLKTIKQGVSAQVDGIKDRDQAEALKGTKIYADRQQMPETEDDEFYFVDLIGLQVVNGVDEEIGTVSNMHDYGAGGVVEVTLTTARKGIGKIAMVPFDSDVVAHIDLKNQQMVILLDEWLDGEIVVDPQKSVQESA